MQSIKKYRHSFIFIFVLLYSIKIGAQCGKININGDEYAVTLQYDKNERLSSITGLDNEEGPKSLNFSTGASGLPLPVGQKEIRWADNGDGNFIITFSSAEGEEENRSMYKISNKGKLLTWDITEEDAFKTIKYTYDKNGDLAKMTWSGIHYDTKVTDKGELIATFDRSRPDAIMKGGPMLFLVTAGWQMFPMTNSHLITSLSYTQTIHMPEMERSYRPKRYDDNHHEIFEKIPPKDITSTITRNFFYTRDENGRASSVTVTGKGGTKKFQFIYSDCN